METLSALGLSNGEDGRQASSRLHDVKSDRVGGRRDWDTSRPRFIVFSSDGIEKPWLGSFRGLSTARRRSSLADQQSPIIPETAVNTSQRPPETGRHTERAPWETTQPFISPGTVSVDTPVKRCIAPAA